MRLHQTVTVGPFFVGDLIAYSAGALITLLLLILTLRAARLPGTPLTNVAFAACALSWSVGGLLYAMMRASGAPREELRIAHTIQLAGSAAFPIPVLRVWRSFAPKVRG